MPNLWIHEYQTLSARPSDAPIVPLDRLLDEQVVPFTTHTESIPLTNNTYVVRLMADADCHVSAGPAPVATTTSVPLKAGQPEYFSVNPGALISVVVAA